MVRKIAYAINIALDVGLIIDQQANTIDEAIG